MRCHSPCAVVWSWGWGGELEEPPGPFAWMRVFGGGSRAAALGGLSELTSSPRVLPSIYGSTKRRRRRMLPYAMRDRRGFGLASWEGATLEGG